MSITPRVSVAVNVAPIEDVTVTQKYFRLFPTYVMATSANKEKALNFRGQIYREAEILQRELSPEEAVVIGALNHIIRNCP